MSATLGRGGELERTTGINQIMKVETPKAYLKHGIGRRLFLFPDLAKEKSEYESWLVNLIGASKRTLVLCPTGRVLKELVLLLQESGKIDNFSVQPILRILWTSFQNQNRLF